MSAVESATKTCTGCGETKNLAEFYRKNTSPDGRDTRCKHCRRPYYRERARARRQADPEGERERLRRNTQRWRERVGPDANRQPRAWNRALAQLRKRHEREFNALYRLAREEEGLPPP